MLDSGLTRDPGGYPVGPGPRSSPFKGTAALLVALAVFVALAIFIRSFFLIIVAAALAAVVILHFWNKRPVKTPEDDQVRLNLDK